MNKRMTEHLNALAQIPMEEIDVEKLTKMAYPHRPCYIGNHKKHGNLIRMYCSCGSYSSEYGKKFKHPIWTKDGYVCPYCGELTMNIGNLANKPYSYGGERAERAVTVFENHDGCDFIRIFLVRYEWWRGHKANPQVFEIARWIYDRDGYRFMMRRKFSSFMYEWTMHPDNPLKFFESDYQGNQKLELGVWASTGNLSQRFRNAHLDCKAVAESTYLWLWLAMVNDPDFDHRLETLVEKGYGYLVVNHLSSHGWEARDPLKWWPQVKMAMRRGYKMTDTWFDELVTLQKLKLDITDPSTIFPDDIERQHARHTAQLNLIQERLEREQRIKDALARLPDQEKKYADTFTKRVAKYMSVLVTAPGIVIRPLKTIREFADEGNAMSHCLFTNEYYKVEDYLVMSAVDALGKRLETVTISIKKREILYSLGKNNKHSLYHNRIVYAVEKAMNAILAGKTFDLKDFPDDVLAKEFSADVLAAQNHLPTMFDDDNEDYMFDDIRFKKAYQADGNEVVIALKICDESDEKPLWGDGSFTVRKAKVIGIYDVNGTLTDMTKAKSLHDRTFEYEVGKECRPSNEDESPSSSGIYCWGTFGAALHYWANERVPHEGAAA